MLVLRIIKALIKLPFRFLWIIIDMGDRRVGNDYLSWLDSW